MPIEVQKTALVAAKKDQYHCVDKGHDQARAKHELVAFLGGTRAPAPRDAPEDPHGQRNQNSDEKAVGLLQQLDEVLALSYFQAVPDALLAWESDRGRISSSDQGLMLAVSHHQTYPLGGL